MSLVLKLRRDEEVIINGVTVRNGHEYNTVLQIVTPDAKVLRVRETIAEDAPRGSLYDVTDFAQGLVSGEIPDNLHNRDVLMTMMDGLPPSKPIAEATHAARMGQLYRAFKALRGELES